MAESKDGGEGAYQPSQEEVESATAFLQTKQGNTSLYDHLTEVVLKLITEQPRDALGRFEHLSSVVKQGSYPQADPLEVAGGESERKELVEAAKTWAKQNVNLFKADEEEEAGEPVQDLTGDMQYLEWAGVSLGKEDAFRLHLSMKRLAASQSVRQMRFWGKLLGKTRDYFVVEGTAEAEEEEEEVEKDGRGNTIEKPGEGVNKFSYWVCHAPGDPWVKLPNATPEQVAIAGEIRRILTGDLEAPVRGHPPFPGKEKAYLRALIARISAETVVAPSGIYKESEDEENFDVEMADEEEEPFEPVDLNDPSNWVHYMLPINRLGRTKPNPAPTDEEGEEVEDPNAPPRGQLLKPAAEDKVYGRMDGEEEEEDDGTNEPGSAWGLRACPSAGPPSGLEETKVMVTAKNRRWPGAVAVGLGRKFVNCYVGYGIQNLRQPYSPSLPAPLATEYDVTAEGQELREQQDVKEDPDEGKEEEEEEAEEDEED